MRNGAVHGGIAQLGAQPVFYAPLFVSWPQVVYAPIVLNFSEQIWGVLNEILKISVQQFHKQHISFGGIAQLGERLNGIQEVSGSIPLISTRYVERLVFYGMQAFLFPLLSKNGIVLALSTAIQVLSHADKIEKAVPMI